MKGKTLKPSNELLNQSQMHIPLNTFDANLELFTTLPIENKKLEINLNKNTEHKSSCG